MTNREKEILKRLRINPLISQNDLADALGITRSSVGVHITNLMKKGIIVGKGYIVREDEYVCVIGGSNIDIQGIPSGRLIEKDSNVGKVTMSLGGVGRNIAENLVRLGFSTRLISVIGDDLHGQKILDEARLIGLEMQDSLILKGMPTSTYLSILDDSKDMALAISHMEIYDQMTVEFIKSKKHILEHAAICVLDTNLPVEVMAYTLTTFKDKVFFLDTVSTTKAKKIAHLIGHFHTIKPNKIEAEHLTGVTITTEEDLHKAAFIFHEKGVKQVFITLGAQGVFYSDGAEHGHLKTAKIKSVNATGAGDAFTAGLVAGFLKRSSIKATAKMAMAASIIALSHENTINPEMSMESLENQTKELILC